MNKRIVLMLGTLLAVPVISFGGVALATESEHSDSTKKPETTSATSKSTEAKTATEPETTDDSKGLADRLTARKNELKTKLTTLQVTRLKAVCKPAQTKGETVKTKVQAVVADRSTVYKDVVDRLTTLATKLKVQGVDTTELEKEITTLQTQITTFKTDLTSYQQAVGDTVSMDCASDPTGFQASLDSARTLHDKLVTDSQAIKTYVTGIIKPTLQAIRAQLEKSEGTSAEPKTDDTTTKPSAAGSH